jgi:hypothetical protein
MMDAVFRQSKQLVSDLATGAKNAARGVAIATYR